MNSTIYRHPYNNVNVKFSAHDAFLESPSSGMLKVESFANQIILNFLEAIKTL